VNLSTLTFILSHRRLCRNEEKPMAVMLSAAKHLAFSVTYEDEILRLPPQDDIATQSLEGEEKLVPSPLAGAGEG
jgi:hypothetical protein